MEIVPGVHVIMGGVGGRPLQLALLLGDSRTVLLDSGSSPDPERLIFPYIESLGRNPYSIDLVINTHPDFDHCGGNTAIRRANPRVLISCGEADRPLIEDPAVMMEQRYNRYAGLHGIGYDDETKQFIRQMLGDPQPVDFTWTGGETLGLGSGWSVEIHHAPGHSSGHLILVDPRHRLALTADAVQGAVYLDTEGSAALCPTYIDVDAYLGTLRYVRCLGAETLMGCHWPIKHGAEIAAFLDESAQFVALSDRLLLSEIARYPEGATLRELIALVGPELGDWPRSVDPELVYALSGHLDRLTAQGKLTADSTERPIRYSTVRTV